MCPAIFILGIIISPWHHSWDLGIMQLVIVCACWMLKIRMSQRFAITLDTPRIYHYFYLVLSQYQPAQPSAQPTHAPTQTSLHCSWKYLLIISEKIDQQIIRSEFMVDKMLQLCQHSWSKEKRTMCPDCQWIVEALFDQCCKFKTQESDFRLTTLEFSWR